MAVKTDTLSASVCATDRGRDPVRRDGSACGGHRRACSPIVGVAPSELSGTRGHGRFDDDPSRAADADGGHRQPHRRGGRADTVRQFLTPREWRHEHGAWLSFSRRLPLRPGLREVRLSVEQDDDRGSIFGAAIDPATAGFSASDVVLGSDRGRCPGGGTMQTVRVSPFHGYPARRVGAHLLRGVWPDERWRIPHDALAAAGRRHEGREQP